MDDGAVRRISKFHMIEDHLGIFRIARPQFTFFILHFGLPQKPKDPLASSCGRLQTGGGVCHMCQRLREQLYIHDKGHDGPEINHSPLLHEGARHADCDISEIPHKLHRRHHDSAVKLTFPVIVEKQAVQPCKFPAGLILAAVCLHDGMPGVNLLYMPVELSQVPLATHKILLRVGDDVPHCSKSDKA
ncbi:hypothetical protein SDC9_163127 [bioreactor metagenome]|uniref:Uncharacterized protein n=1 Tax=bioreactor metagenome TaxID=1076179 RepID=A0A645FN09_9ZZZZ